MNWNKTKKLNLRNLRWRLKSYIVMGNSQVVKQFSLRQMPDEKREGFLSFIPANKNSEMNNSWNHERIQDAFVRTHRPSPDTNREFKNRSSPALNVVTQSPDSRFIRFTYIRLRDKQTKCCASWSPKYGIFWFMTPFNVTWGIKKFNLFIIWGIHRFTPADLPWIFLRSSREHEFLVCTRQRDQNRQRGKLMTAAEPL